MTDTERLDWLIDHKAFLHFLPSKGEWTVWAPDHPKKLYLQDPDLRLAIDKAINPPKTSCAKGR